MATLGTGAFLASSPTPLGTLLHPSLPSAWWSRRPVYQMSPSGLRLTWQGFTVTLVRKVTQRLKSQEGRRESAELALLPSRVSVPSSCNTLFLMTVRDYCANQSFLFQAQFLLSGSIWLHVRILYILVIENLNQTGLRKKEMHHLGYFACQSQNTQ